jgi:hypothetical protein
VVVFVQRLPYFILDGGCQTFSLSVPHIKLVSDMVVVCPSLGPPFFPESVIFHILSFEKGSLGIIGLSSAQFSEKGSQVTPVVGWHTLSSHFWTVSLPSLKVSFRSPSERKVFAFFDNFCPIYSLIMLITEKGMGITIQITKRY